MCNDRNRLSKQSNMIGPAKGAKRFIAQILSGSNKSTVYRSASKANNTKETNVIMKCSIY